MYFLLLSGAGQSIRNCGCKVGLLNNKNWIMRKVAQKYSSSSADLLVVLMDFQENTVEAARDMVFESWDLVRVSLPSNWASYSSCHQIKSWTFLTPFVSAASLPFKPSFGKGKHLCIAFLLWHVINSSYYKQAQYFKITRVTLLHIKHLQKFIISLFQLC